MIAYASRTGTRRNLDLLRREGWRLLISATGCHRSEGFPYAIDNGAWTAHQQGTDFNYSLFRKLLGSHGAGADWFVLPDIVAGGVSSLRRSTAWLEHEECPTLPLLAVQDGIRPEHVVDLVGPEVGLAVGGSTEWKLRTLHAWGKLAQRTGCYVHALRVNTLVRLNLCRDAGIHSFDGSGASRFYKAGLVMSAGLRQQHLMEVKP